VPGFGFPPGRSAYFSAVAADGTVFTGGIDHIFNFVYMTADDMVVAAYDPKYHTYRNINIRTTTGKEAIADLRGASIADVEAVSGGNGIAFTGPVSWRGQDASVDGEWPTFGVLTKVAGQWQVAAGNQWTGGQLARSNPPVSALACPPEAGHPDVSQCGGPNEMDTLPASGHIIIAQYFSGLMAVDLRGPDTSGRYDPKVAGAYPPLKVKDVTTPDPDDEILLFPRDVQADPTGVLGDERFALMFDREFPRGSKLEAAGFIEFSYDARTGQIRPVSGPILRGDRNAGRDDPPGVRVQSVLVHPAQDVEDRLVVWLRAVGQPARAWRQATVRRPPVVVALDQRRHAGGGDHRGVGLGDGADGWLVPPARWQPQAVLGLQRCRGQQCGSGGGVGETSQSNMAGAVSCGPAHQAARATNVPSRSATQVHSGRYWPASARRR
jgi:hypothetical protein